MSGSSSFVVSDETAIRAALAQARAALDHGDVPIGAVVLSGTGAVRGSWNLSGCTLAVTLEPCTMCAGAIVLARVARLVFGAWDPKAGAVGSLWDVVRDRRLNHRPEVAGGVRADECGRLLAEFFADRR